ncbi:MAG: homoserine dehydrogenase, partial [Methylophilaceae bacterium]
VGPTLYYGAGAGAEPTASAVIADLIDIARLKDANDIQRAPALGYQADQVQDLMVLPIAEITSAYYLRMHATDKPGVIAAVTKILADRAISIDAMIQPAATTGADIVLLTHETVEKNMDAAIAEIEALSDVEGKLVKLRMESLG